MFYSLETNRKTCLNISFKTEESLPLPAKTKFPAFLMPKGLTSTLCKYPCFVLQIDILTPSSRPTFHLFNLVSLQRVKHHYTFRFRPRKVYQYGTRPNSKPFYSKPSIIWRLCKGPMFSNTDCYFDSLLKIYSSLFHFG